MPVSTPPSRKNSALGGMWTPPTLILHKFDSHKSSVGMLDPCEGLAHLPDTSPPPPKKNTNSGCTILTARQSHLVRLTGVCIRLQQT